MLAPTPLRKYRIERYLTEGGMGAIYLGKKIGAGGFEKEVVLKQLLPEFTARPEFRDLFFREAKISASLDHVNIVRTYDLVASNDALFIVMEYVCGADLRTIAWRARMLRQALSPAAVLHVGMEILAGLGYAHARRTDQGAALGIIHRDVSPSNVLCSGQGDVKLSDFGIAKATTFSSVFYRVRGKVGYMSPEQARSQPLDGRSDLFSLAVVLFETLTGERLFTGDLHTPPEVIYAQRIPRLSLKRPDLPRELEPVFTQALAADPARRFQDAGAFAAALREVARRSGLLYSAPALAAELTELLGPDAAAWGQDPADAAAGADTGKIPLGRADLEGREVQPVRGVVPAERATGEHPAAALPRLPPARSAPSATPVTSPYTPDPRGGAAPGGEEAPGPRNGPVLRFPAVADAPAGQFRAPDGAPAVRRRGGGAALVVTLSILGALSAAMALAMWRGYLPDVTPQVSAAIEGLRRTLGGAP